MNCASRGRYKREAVKSEGARILEWFFATVEKPHLYFFYNNHGTIRKP
jgi:hypothetical protein